MCEYNIFFCLVVLYLVIIAKKIKNWRKWIVTFFFFGVFVLKNLCD